MVPVKVFTDKTLSFYFIFQLGIGVLPIWLSLLGDSFGYQFISSLWSSSLLGIRVLFPTSIWIDLAILRYWSGGLFLDINRGFCVWLKGEGGIQSSKIIFRGKIVQLLESNFLAKITSANFCPSFSCSGIFILSHYVTLCTLCYTMTEPWGAYVSFFEESGQT